MLQYVAASFHLPSVSTANINTVQYTKPYQQYEIPTVPAVVISKVLLLQPQHHDSLCSLPQHSLLWYLSRLAKIQQSCYTICSSIHYVRLLLPPHTPPHIVQLPANSSTFYLSMPNRNVVIILSNWVTNYACWIVAEQNARCGFCHISYFEVIYWAQ